MCGADCIFYFIFVFFLDGHWEDSVGCSENCLPVRVVVSCISILFPDTILFISCLHRGKLGLGLG